MGDGSQQPTKPTPEGHKVAQQMDKSHSTDPSIPSQINNPHPGGHPPANPKQEPKHKAPQVLVQNFGQTGIIVGISKATQLKSSNHPLYIQIRTDDLKGQRVPYNNNPAKKTRLAPKDKSEWNETVFYNSSELVDDNITFILKQQDGTELGRHCERNVKFLQRDNQNANRINKTFELKYNNTDHVANLHVMIEFRNNQDVISGISVPNLSLAPQYPYNPKYNALDGYNPNSKSNRANCFSFYDGDVVPGFDHIDMFPPKFKLPKDLK